jgi:hypothetical protein
VVAIACCAAAYATAFLDGHATAVVSLVAMLGFLPSLFVLWSAVQQAADLPDSLLDEREVAQRDRAYLSAYRVVGAVAAVTVVLAISDDARPGLVTSWIGPWTALLLLTLALPSVVLALGQPAVDDHPAPTR